MGTGFIERLRVPVSGATIGEAEKANLIDVAKRGWFTDGKYCEEFTDKLKQYINTPFLHLINSGSSATLLAVSALCSRSLGEKRLKPGDEVITVAAGFPTTVNPILQNGLVPVFVDIDIPTYNVNISRLANAITSKTKAIMLAHTLGNPFNISAVKALANLNNLWLIEDCCDALGSAYRERVEGIPGSYQHVGTFGDIGTLSFFPAHQITTGEGGAVFTKHERLSKIIRRLRDWGRDCACKPGQNNKCRQRFDASYGTLPHGFDHKYVFTEVGYNLKMTEMQAAIGSAQMDRIDDFVLTRRHNFSYLEDRLNGIDALILPETEDFSLPSWFGFPITTKDRHKLVRFLDKHGIDTRMLFAGNLTRQPYMLPINFWVSGGLKNTDRVMNETFWIGVYQGITEEMMNYQVEMLKEFYTVRGDKAA